MSNKVSVRKSLFAISKSDFPMIIPQNPIELPHVSVCGVLPTIPVFASFDVGLVWETAGGGFMRCPVTRNSGVGLQ
jgi:hypothetical protein